MKYTKKLMLLHEEVNNFTLSKDVKVKLRLPLDIYFENGKRASIKKVEWNNWSGFDFPDSDLYINFNNLTLASQLELMDIVTKEAECS